MKTLRNLQQMVDVADLSAFKQVPTPKAIRESGAEVVESIRTSDGSELKVYDIGLVVYSNGIRATVFPLHKVHGDYCYQSATCIYSSDLLIPEEDLMSMPWYLGLIMFAEDRIVRSQENSKVYREIVYLGSLPPEAVTQMESAENPEELFLLKEKFQENMDMLRYALSQVTENQHEILLDYFFEDKKQCEIASERGTSPQNVSKTYQRGLDRMRKALGVDPSVGRKKQKK